MVALEKVIRVNNSSNRGCAPIAADIVACVENSGCTVSIKKQNRTVSGSSLIGILSLGITEGDELSVYCSGESDSSVDLCLDEINKILE